MSEPRSDGAPRPSFGTPPRISILLQACFARAEQRCFAGDDLFWRLCCWARWSWGFPSGKISPPYARLVHPSSSELETPDDLRRIYKQVLLTITSNSSKRSLRWLRLACMKCPYHRKRLCKPTSRGHQLHNISKAT
jgi:hypothetical protein